MNKEKFGFSTLSRLLGKKNKDKSTTKAQENNQTSQQVMINTNKAQINKSNLQLSQQLSQPQQTQLQQHNNVIAPLVAATSNAPFEQTFRITVLLPRDQLYVARLGARAKLKQLLHIVCENKQLAEEQLEFRDPIDSSQVFDLESTIGTVGLSEIRLCNKNEQKYNTNFNSDDILKIRSQTATTGRNSVTSSDLSSRNSTKITSKTSPYSSTNSLNSMDSTGMHASYTTPINFTSSGGLVPSNDSVKPPIAPMRKKRVAPRPPSQISVPEKEVLPPTTDWNRPNQKLATSMNGERINEQQFDSNGALTDSVGSLQKKEFSSSTPNLHSNGTIGHNLAIYGEIDLNESCKSIDCNGNNQASQENYNYVKQNGSDDREHFEMNTRNMQNRSISIQYGNNYDKHYFGSMQNFSNPYDRGSYLSLNNHPSDSEGSHNGKDFPKPSPRKTVNIKKKTAAPPPPPRTFVPLPKPQPRESIPSNLSQSVENINENGTQETSSPVETKVQMKIEKKHMNGSPVLEKPNSPQPDDISYTDSQISEISIECRQSSRSASTVSITSQNPSVLEENLINLVTPRASDCGTSRISESVKSQPVELPSTNIKQPIVNTIPDVDDTAMIFIPAPPTFADVFDSKINNEPDQNSSPVPKIVVAIEKQNSADYKHDTDIVTEAFKDIYDMPDENTEIIEEIKIKKTIVIGMKEPAFEDDVKENIAIINSDTEDGYQGNKIGFGTVEVKNESNAVNENQNSDRFVEKMDIIETAQAPSIEMVEANEEKKNIENKVSSEQIIPVEFEKCVKRKSESEPYNKIDNLKMPDIILKTQTSTQKEANLPATPPPTPVITESNSTKIKTSENRLYENRATLKLSNSIKFRKSIGRSDSFHATQHYISSESDSDSRSLSFLSLLAAQREEIRSQSVAPDPYRKLNTNRKSTSDLRINEPPNLQSLSIMKSILSSQNNLHRMDSNDESSSSTNLHRTLRSAVDDDDDSSMHNRKCSTHDSSPTKSEEIPKISSILTVRKKSEVNSNDEVCENTLLNDGRKTSNGGGSGDANDDETKKWKYQGRPNINLSTWSERPKHSSDVTIKNEGDYIFGGANVKRTSSISTLQRNRMSLPVIPTNLSLTTTSQSNGTYNHYTPDFKRQSIADIKLRKQNEEPDMSSTLVTSKFIPAQRSSLQTSEFPDFRSTLRKSQNSALLYAMSEDPDVYSNKTDSNGLQNESETSEKSFKEKTKSFGPVVVRRTTGVKESLLLAGKPIMPPVAPNRPESLQTVNGHAVRDNSGPMTTNMNGDKVTVTTGNNINIMNDNKVTVNAILNYETNEIKQKHFVRKSSNTDFVMPVKMQINEKALYDDTNSDGRNSILRPILVKQNFNVNMPKRTSGIGVITTQPKPPPPPIKPGAITKTTINTQVEGDSKMDFLAEIRKFNKKNLKTV